MIMPCVLIKSYVLNSLLTFSPLASRFVCLCLSRSNGLGNWVIRYKLVIHRKKLIEIQPYRSYCNAGSNFRLEISQ